MISLQGLTKAYARSKTKAVDGISLEIPNGKILGFLGPNGAGKTTTIKLITGILNPDAGTVTIDGIDAAKDPIRAKMRLGYVPDNPELFPRLKASEYLNFVADVYEVPTAERQERIKRYATRFKILDVLGARINSYSHGMKQKLALTASLLHEPANWILDEPLVGLDPEAAFDIKEIMRDRVKAGNSVFFSTHIMEVAEKLCDEICIIKEGVIVFTGEISELKKHGGSNESLESLFLELVDSGEGA